jgi:hypothetical protein
MKIEYDETCANVLRHCPLPCLRCTFNFRACIGMSICLFSCDRDGFEKDTGYIFKV